MKDSEGPRAHSSLIPHLSSLVSRDPLPRALALVLLAAYIVIIAAVAAHHEPWRDEADAWLAARDAGASALWHFFHHGGTPGLWYALLIPLARGGAPYGAQEVLHGIIACASAAIVLFASPFPRIARVLLPFSYYFGYEYAVIARSYALSVLLLLIIAALHERRYDRPVAYAVAVALLANTNVHSLAIAALIGLAYLLETWGRLSGGPEPARSRLYVSAIAIMLAGGLLALAQVWPTGDAMVRGAISVFHPDAPAQAIRAAFFPMIIIPHAMAIALGVAIILTALWTIRRSRFALLVLLGTYAFFGYLFIFKWFGGLRHAGFVFLVLLFALWIGDSFRSAVCWTLLTIMLAASGVASVYVWRLDWKYAFSGAQEMAEFIRGSGMASTTIAAHSQTTASALCPYFDHPFWYAGIEEFGTYSKWDSKFARGLEVTYPEAVRRVGERFPDRSRVLLLLNVEMPAPERNGWRLLHHNRRPQFMNLDESFWLYGALR